MKLFTPVPQKLCRIHSVPQSNSFSSHPPKIPFSQGESDGVGSGLPQRLLSPLWHKAPVRIQYVLPLQIWYYSQGRVPTEPQLSHLFQQKPLDPWSHSSWTSQNHTVCRPAWTDAVSAFLACQARQSFQTVCHRKSGSPYSFSQNVHLCPALQHSLETELQLSKLSCCKAKAQVPGDAPTFWNCGLNFLGGTPSSCSVLPTAKERPVFQSCNYTGNYFRSEGSCCATGPECSQLLGHEKSLAMIQCKIKPVLIDKSF